MARRNARSVSEAIIRLSGCPVLLGTIDYTDTSKTNAEASTPFNAASPALAGKIILVQPSTDCYILPVLTSTSVVASTTGVLLLANERLSFTLEDYDERAVDGEVRAWLAAIRSASNGNLKVWELV